MVEFSHGREARLNKKKRSRTTDGKLHRLAASRPAKCTHNALVNPFTLFRSTPRRISRAGWRRLSSSARTFPSFLSITRSFACGEKKPNELLAGIQYCLSTCHDYLYLDLSRGQPPPLFSIVGPPRNEIS